MHDEDAAKIDQDQQSAEAGAAEDEQGLGQHDDKDVTDVETKQDHPATPRDGATGSPHQCVSAGPDGLPGPAPLGPAGERRVVKTPDEATVVSERHGGLLLAQGGELWRPLLRFVESSR